MPTLGKTTDYLRSLALVVWHQLLVRCQQKKQLQRGKSSGNNARQGEGSDLSDYIPEHEEPDDGDDDTDLENEATPLENEVHIFILA